ncbi:MAG: diguanylate cyclase [Proteobacteria bacterium]|nr:diguanylate cyclase [Pseudomonadota bacterium]MCP4920518.1 diguanylate cyclase [Pseudomonadota bacterium]
MSIWKAKSEQMPSDVASDIERQLAEIRELADAQEEDPHVTGILMACFSRLKKTAETHGLEDLAETAQASAADCKGGNKDRALERFIAEGGVPLSVALPPIVVLAHEALAVRLDEEATPSVQLILFVSSVEELQAAVAAHRPRHVILPSEAVDEVLALPDDPRRHVWLYQPCASIDMEARADALRRGAAGFVGWPLRLSDCLKRARAPLKGQSGLPYRAMIFEGGMGERALRVLDGPDVHTSTETDRSRVLAALDREGSEIFIVDLDVHGGHALNLARTINSHERLRDVQVLGLSRKGAMSEHASAAGIRHFVRVPITDPGLRGRAVGAMREVRHVRSIAETDAITGVLNRHAFLERADHALALSHRQGEGLVAAVIDVVDLTGINARSSLGAGDRVLRLLAEVLMEDLRRTDIIGRIGGDGIGVVLPGCTVAKAHTLMEEAYESFTAWFRPGSALAATQLTTGIVELSDDPRGLLWRAENVMLQAEPGTIAVG